jgi:hypothetical protein
VPLPEIKQPTSRYGMVWLVYYGTTKNVPLRIH